MNEDRSLQKPLKDKGSVLRSHGDALQTATWRCTEAATAQGLAPVLPKLGLMLSLSTTFLNMTCQTTPLESSIPPGPSPLKTPLQGGVVGAGSPGPRGKLMMFGICSRCSTFNIAQLQNSTRKQQFISFDLVM